MTIPQTLSRRSFLRTTAIATIAASSPVTVRAFDASGFSGATDLRPVRFADVEILAGSTSLGKGATGTDGSFSIQVTGSTADSARVKIRTCAATAIACAAEPGTWNETTDPNPSGICLAASAWPGWSARPG